MTHRTCANLLSRRSRLVSRAPPLIETKWRVPREAGEKTNMLAPEIFSSLHRSASTHFPTSTGKPNHLFFRQQTNQSPVFYLQRDRSTLFFSHHVTQNLFIAQRMFVADQTLSTMPGCYSHVISLRAQQLHVLAMPGLSPARRGR